MFYIFKINYLNHWHIIMIFNDVIMCVYMSVIWQAKLLEMGIGQKEQIGPLCSQNVGLKIRTRK